MKMGKASLEPQELWKGGCGWEGKEGLAPSWGHAALPAPLCPNLGFVIKVFRDQL